MILKNSNKKNGLVIADAGHIFSLAIINKLEILGLLFDNILIPTAVWQEITLDKTTKHYKKTYNFFINKTIKIKGFNELLFIMDYGESEALTLYKEQDADFLLIDDKKARNIAETLGLNCIGTIGILSAAKNKKIISELKSLFEKLLENKRFYSIKLLNTILAKQNESLISKT